MGRKKAMDRARRVKNDEFYTQYKDIEEEIEYYYQYNKDVFKDKTILLPCDEPESSNFTQYFIDNFNRFKMKRLISTCYIKNGKGKYLEYTGSNKNWTYLKGNGDFQSDEVTKLRDECDIIITNPPFSLFGEFFDWIVKGKKKFAIMGNINCLAYKNIFPLIRKNKIWPGVGWKSMSFETKHDFYDEIIDGKKMKRVKGIIWLTNLEHGNRHEPLQLTTMAENLRFNKRIMNNKNSYKEYDNYKAIEIPFTNGIPSDYDGVMGVPMSFLDKWNPEQFEILGLARYITGDLYIDNKQIYHRFLIKHK